MFGLFSKKKSDTSARPQSSGDPHFPGERFALSKGSAQGMPVVAMINTAYKNYTFGKEFPCHTEIEIAIQDKTAEGLTSSKEADHLNKVEDLLLEELGKAGLKVHFIARQTWNGKRILDWYTNDRALTDTTLRTCIERSLLERPCTYNLKDEPGWETSKAFLQNF
ncbi:MAG: DUF695 domain-containing protein [Alphaproteobacteria bacterium]